MLVEATPGLISLFEFFGQILEGVVGIFRDAMDPSTELGESVAALGIQFESLLKTIFGEDFTLADFFEGASAALGIFLDFMHDLLRIIENTIIGFQVMGEQLGMLFTGQWDKLLNFDAAGEIRKRIDFKDTIQANKLKVKEYIAEWDNARKLDIEGHNDTIGKTADAWERALRAKSNYLRPAGLTGTADSMERQLTPEGVVIPSVGGTGTDTGKTGAGSAAAALSGYQELQKGLVFEGKKAVLQAKLVGTNLAQGLVDKILTGKAPLKTAGKILTDVLKKDGSVRNKAVTNLNTKFAATYSEVNRVAEESARAAAAQAQESKRLAEELEQAEKARIAGLDQLYANFLDTIKGTFAGIRNAIQGAFDITGLGGSTNAILRNMDKLLTKLKSFSTNVKQLATMGLDPALLQQIITAGPMAGARIASALVAGGAGALSAINAGYGQVGNLASEIATTGVQSLFDTQKQQNVYNITVTGGVGSGSTIGKAIVDAIKDYERTSGAVWQGA
jgi:molecular chaperone GrpE (heat shock protein)